MSRQEQILDDIVAHLVSELGSVCDFAKYPASPSEYNRGVSKPICFVAYVSSEASSWDQLGGSSQTLETNFVLAFSGSQLYGTNGILDLVDLVMLALVGFKPSFCFEPYARIQSVQPAKQTENDKLHKYDLEVSYILPHN